MNDRRADDADPISVTRRKRRLTSARAVAALWRCCWRRAAGTTSRRTREPATPRRRRGTRHHRLVAHPEQRPGLSAWQAMADAYMAEHPNVTINITVMENEAFKAALQTNLQAGDVPDLFQSWGGGGLRDQVDAGLVQDITDASSRGIGDLNGAAAAVQGRRRAVRRAVQPGHRRVLVQQGPLRPGRHRRATRRPGTSCSRTSQTLKDAGITPIAVGAGDKWPAHFWYSYLMVRASAGPT